MELIFLPCLTPWTTEQKVDTNPKLLDECRGAAAWPSLRQRRWFGKEGIWCEDGQERIAVQWQAASPTDLPAGIFVSVPGSHALSMGKRHMSLRTESNTQPRLLSEDETSRWSEHAFLRTPCHCQGLGRATTILRNEKCEVVPGGRSPGETPKEGPGQGWGQDLKCSLQRWQSYLQYPLSNYPCPWTVMNSRHPNILRAILTGATENPSLHSSERPLATSAKNSLVFL
jgi:hypothetical protein